MQKLLTVTLDLTSIRRLNDSLTKDFVWLLHFYRENIQRTFSSSNTHVSKSFLSFFEKNPITADLQFSRVIFFFIIKWYIVYAH